METNLRDADSQTGERPVDADDVAERQIRSVIRVFRWIGWPGTIIYVPMVIGPIGTLVYSIFVEKRNRSLC